MMGRIAESFKNRNSPAFIGFTVAGDPDRETCIRAARALIDGGTDVLELGVPFSDPVADGPTIQKADERALATGTTPDTVFSIVREVRKNSEVPIVFLAYYNTVYRRGIRQFYREAREAGVDGILIADMPYEESDEVTEAANEYGIDPIMLITQTTTDARIKKIVSRARGYLYLVAVLGVTGARATVSDEALDLLRRVRRHTDLPLALGFGISLPDHARTCTEQGADGIIVGSAIVDIVGRNKNDPAGMENELMDYVSRMKASMETANRK
jgi:tryptophan synthase alpha chain